MLIAYLATFCVATYSLLNLWAFLHNRRLFRFRSDYSKAERLLVIVAHQDDETIVAGGAMLKTLKKGGTVQVVYTTDGSNRTRSKTDESVRSTMATRERETVACLTSIGAPAENVLFLRYEAVRGLQEPANVVEAIEKVASLIDRVQPDTIIIPSFEGGHCDHDITNYLVAKAAARVDFPRENILEAPEYNRYYLSEAFFRRMNGLLLVKFCMPPRFLPGDGRVTTLDMTKEELQAKVAMFGHFTSQRPDILVDRFGFPDQVRPLPSYRYTGAPFNPADSLRHWLAVLVKRD